jgi:hypothetical protein
MPIVRSATATRVTRATTNEPSAGITKRGEGLACLIRRT